MSMGYFCRLPEFGVWERATCLGAAFYVCPAIQYSATTSSSSRDLLSHFSPTALPVVTGASAANLPGFVMSLILMSLILVSCSIPQII